MVGLRLNTAITRRSSLEPIVAQALGAIGAAGGEVLDFNCLRSSLVPFQDKGEYLLALDIKAASEAAGGTVLDMSCLYQLAKAITP